MILFMEEWDLKNINEDIIESFSKLMNVIVAKEIIKMPNCKAKQVLLPKAEAWLKAINSSITEKFEKIKDIDSLLVFLNSVGDPFKEVNNAFEILNENNMLLSTNINRKDEVAKLYDRMKVAGIKTNLLKLNEDALLASDYKLYSLRTIYRIVLIGHNGLKSRGITNKKF